MIFVIFVFQSWAKDSDARTSIENTLTYAYYSKLFLYILINIILILHFISTHFNNNNLLLYSSYRFINLLPVLFFSLVWDHCIQCVPIATIHVFLL